MKSLLAVLAYNEDRFDNVKSLLLTLNAYDYNNIVVCTKLTAIPMFQALCLPAVQYIDCTDTNRPQAKNKIIKFAKEHGYSKLHIFEDDVIIHNNSFIPTIEKMMDMLGYSYVFNHLSNIQNYACGIVAPRLCIGNIPGDLPLIDFYSYEGKEYICIDLDKTMDNVLYYDESLNYYYHCHNIWRRRNFDKTQMPFLNFYPFIEKEITYIERRKDIDSNITKEIVEVAKAEITKTNLKWEPDTSIDDVLAYTSTYIQNYNKEVK